MQLNETDHTNILTDQISTSVDCNFKVGLFNPLPRFGGYRDVGDTYGLSMTVSELFLADPKSVSASPPVPPGYYDKYRSGSYCFVERQKRSQIKLSVLDKLLASLNRHQVLGMSEL